VNETTPAGKEPGAARKLGAGQWLDYRRKRFWLAALVVVYTLCGFLLVPVLVKSTTIGTLQDDFGRHASIERVRFNPYSLRLEVESLAVSDPDGEKLAGFDRLVVNLQVSSLFRWAWTLREFRLEGFYGLLERFAPGDTRLTRLLADQAARAEPESPDAPESGGLPRLLIEELTLTGGRIAFRDDVPEDAVILELGPVDISMEDLNTLPDREGQQAVSVRLPGGAVVSWQGSIDLGPVRSEGRFAIENSHLDQTIAYLKAILPLQSIQAVLSLNTNYRIEELADSSLDVELEELEVTLSDVGITGLDPTTSFLTFPSLQLLGGTLRYPGNTLSFSAIRLTDPEIVTWLDPQARLNLLQLAPPTAAEANAAEDAPASDSADWQVDVAEFSIMGGQVQFTDQSISPEAVVGVRDIELTVREISNKPGAEFVTNLSGNLAEGGTFGFDGRVGVLPEVTASGAVSAVGIPLALAQPYVQQHINVLIHDGSLASDMELQLDPEGNVAASGALGITQLEVDDTLENQPLIGWDRLEIDRFEATTAERRVELSRVVFKQPFNRLVIKEDLTTNLSQLDVSASDSTLEAAESEADDPFSIVVGGIAVEDGAMDFADFSLPLPFETRIHRLTGNISTVDTTSAEPSNIRLEGQVDDYGMARIEGAMDLLDPLRTTDVTMEFRNLLMSNLSPYTVQFAGREIAEGKLDLNLGYRIVNGQLQGQNDAVMSELVLGREVDHPDAVSLPLGLAVALLTDANGVIDIELPVEGDVNDPEFKIGGVIWQAFAGLITKIVSAPFRLLGNLIGIESEDLGRFQFLAGRADLTPPELEKVAQLQQALQQRPELGLELKGPFDPAIDVPALQYQRLRDMVLQRLDEDYADPEGEFRMLSDEIRGALEDLFTERFPETPLDSVKAEHMAPPVDDANKAPVLDELAYAGDLRDRLLAAQAIESADLEALARARAEAVRSAFLATGEFDESRIMTADPVASESEEDEWVIMELGVAVD
jgi:hypothetical protein